MDFWATAYKPLIYLLIYCALIKVLSVNKVIINRRLSIGLTNMFMYVRAVSTGSTCIRNAVPDTITEE